MTESIAVTFPSNGMRCAGDLYLPAGFNEQQGDAGKRWPALVICHGFTVTKRSLVKEGRRFAEAGYVTLAIDYCHFGDSGGEPRGFLSPMQEVEDVRNAISFLQRYRGVDAERIGIWGTSFGGGIVSYTAAVDRRVKAVVAQAPILDGYRWLKSLRGAADWEVFLDQVDALRQRRYDEGKSQLISLVEPKPDDIATVPADPRAVKSFTDHFEQTGEPMLYASDVFDLASIEPVMQFDAVNMVHRINPRAYCIIALTGFDIYHPRDLIDEAFKNAGGPKKLVTIKIDQLDIYWDFGRDLALPPAIEWFDEYLKTAP
jgi:dienelactone hydrolase